MTDMVMRVETPAAEIDQFISEITPLIQRYHLSTANAAFLSILLHSQGPPDMTDEERNEGVLGASGYITTYLSSLRSTERPN